MCDIFNQLKSQLPVNKHIHDFPPQLEEKNTVGAAAVKTNLSEAASSGNPQIANKMKPVKRRPERQTVDCPSIDPTADKNRKRKASLAEGPSQKTPEEGSADKRQIKGDAGSGTAHLAKKPLLPNNRTTMDNDGNKSMIGGTVPGISLEVPGAAQTQPKPRGRPRKDQSLEKAPPRENQSVIKDPLATADRLTDNVLKKNGPKRRKSLSSAYSTPEQTLVVDVTPKKIKPVVNGAKRKSLPVATAAATTPSKEEAAQKISKRRWTVKDPAFTPKNQQEVQKKLFAAKGSPKNLKKTVKNNNTSQGDSQSKANKTASPLKNDGQPKPEWTRCFVRLQRLDLSEYSHLLKPDMADKKTNKADVIPRKNKKSKDATAEHSSATKSTVKKPKVDLLMASDGSAAFAEEEHKSSSDTMASNKKARKSKSNSSTINTTIGKKARLSLEQVEHINITAASQKSPSAKSEGSPSASPPRKVRVNADQNAVAAAGPDNNKSPKLPSPAANKPTNKKVKDSSPASPPIPNPSPPKSGKKGRPRKADIEARKAKSPPKSFNVIWKARAPRLPSQQAATPRRNTTPAKFTRTQLIKTFGKRPFCSVVRIERCRHLEMVKHDAVAAAAATAAAAAAAVADERPAPKQIKGPNKTKNLSVSFNEQVEVFGNSDEDSDWECDMAMGLGLSSPVPIAAALPIQASTSAAAAASKKWNEFRTPGPKTPISARRQAIAEMGAEEASLLDASVLNVDKDNASTPYPVLVRKRIDKKSFSPLKDDTPSPHKDRLKMADEKMPSSLRRFNINDIDDENTSEYIVPTVGTEREGLPCRLISTSPLTAALFDSVATPDQATPAEPETLLALVSAAKAVVLPAPKAVTEVIAADLVTAAEVVPAVEPEALTDLETSANSASNLPEVGEFENSGTHSKDSVESLTKSNHELILRPSPTREEVQQTPVDDPTPDRSDGGPPTDESGSDQMPVGELSDVAAELIENLVPTLLSTEEEHQISTENDVHSDNEEQEQEGIEAVEEMVEDAPLEEEDAESYAVVVNSLPINQPTEEEPLVGQEEEEEEEEVENEDEDDVDHEQDTYDQGVGVETETEVVNDAHHPADCDASNDQMTVHCADVGEEEEEVLYHGDVNDDGFTVAFTDDYDSTHVAEHDVVDGTLGTSADDYYNVDDNALSNNAMDVLQSNGDVPPDMLLDSAVEDPRSDILRSPLLASSSVVDIVAETLTVVTSNAPDDLLDSGEGDRMDFEFDKYGCNELNENDRFVNDVTDKLETKVPDDLTLQLFADGE